MLAERQTRADVAAKERKVRHAAVPLATLVQVAGARKSVRELILLLLLAMTQSASAMTLDFEDAPTNRDGFLIGMDNFATKYGDLVWDGEVGSYFQIFDTTQFCGQASAPGPGYCSGTTSGTHVAFNYDTSRVRSETPFDFLGVYINAGFRDDMRVRFQGFRGGTLIYDQLASIDTSGPAWFAFDFLGIDVLELRPDPLSNPGYGPHYVLDDFQFRFVPEPSTAVVLTLGLAAMGAMRSRLAATG